MLPDDLRRDVLVVGLARGGMQTAAAVARRLGAPLDVLAVRKVGHPLQPEYGIGAVTPGGEGVYLRSRDGLTDEEIAEIVHRAKRAADDLDRRLHGDRPPFPIARRTVLLVDDGLAPGATMLAAVRWAQGQGARRIVAAVPVGAAQTVELIRREAEVVCPLAVDDLGAVGLWYEDFRQVGDEDVLALLDEGGAGGPMRRPGGARTVRVAAGEGRPPRPPPGSRVRVASAEVPGEPVGREPRHLFQCAGLLEEVRRSRAPRPRRGGRRAAWPPR